MGVNSLPKTVTRQRRDCDLNPAPFCAWVQHANQSATEPSHLWWRNQNAAVNAAALSAERHQSGGTGYVHSFLIANSAVAIWNSAGSSRLLPWYICWLWTEWACHRLSSRDLAAVQRWHFSPAGDSQSLELFQLILLKVEASHLIPNSMKLQCVPKTSLMSGAIKTQSRASMFPQVCLRRH